MNSLGSPRVRWRDLSWTPISRLSSSSAKNSFNRFQRSTGLQESLICAPRGIATKTNLSIRFYTWGIKAPSILKKRRRNRVRSPRVLSMASPLVCLKILLITLIRLISLKRKRVLRKLMIYRLPKLVCSTQLTLKSKTKQSIFHLTTATPSWNNLKFSKLWPKRDLCWRFFLSASWGVASQLSLRPWLKLWRS